MKKIKFMHLKLGFGVLFALLILSGCAEKTSFSKGDIKDDFCGRFINAQYCKCAFHNKQCDAINMSKGDAKKHVNEKYEEWVEEELERFRDNCRAGNGVVNGENCIQCDIDKVAKNDKCVDDSSEGEEEEEGECKYDNECEAICEGNVKWKMGCNARTNTCEKTFDTDCSADIEKFGELSFPKICVAGECVQDMDNIQAIKAELTQEKQLWSNAVKDINKSRADITAAMMEVNKNCINGIADMTNLAIVEFSTRIASVLAGGIPDIAAMTASAADKASGLIGEHVKNLAGAAVDYAGDALNRLYVYQQGEPAEEEKKLKPHEYIKLNCDLYEYFKGVLAESDTDLQTALNNATEADSLLKQLP